MGIRDQVSENRDYGIRIRDLGFGITDYGSGISDQVSGNRDYGLQIRDQGDQGLGIRD